MCLVLVLLGWVFIELQPILQKPMIASQVRLVHVPAESHTENGLVRFNKFLFLTQRMSRQRRSTHILVSFLQFSTANSPSTLVFPQLFSVVLTALLAMYPSGLLL